MCVDTQSLLIQKIPCRADPTKEIGMGQTGQIILHGRSTQIRVVWNGHCFARASLNLGTGQKYFIWLTYVGHIC